MIKKVLISLLAGVIIIVLISLAQIGYYKYFPQYHTRFAPLGSMIEMREFNLGLPFVYTRSCIEMVCNSITYPILWFILDALIWGLVIFFGVALSKALHKTTLKIKP